MLQKFMEAIQAWITEHVVPVMNKLTSTYWFGVISDAVLYIVPFSMVSAIPSLWNIIRRFVPTLPDLSPLTTFSFGLVGLFMAFIIPHNVAVKEDRKDRSMIAGFTGIGAFMLCMNPTITEDGYVFQMAKFGAGGMFTAMVVGFVVGFIYKRMARMTFFSEDSIKQNTEEVYHTSLGRTVYGGGGIMPDIFVPQDTTGYTSYYMTCVNRGVYIEFGFQYTDKNRQKLEEFKDQASLVAYLKRQNLVDKFASFAETRGIKRRNLMIRKSYPLLEKLVIGSVVNYALDFGDYVQYINESDPTVAKAVEVLEKGESFPKAPQTEEKSE